MSTTLVQAIHGLTIGLIGGSNVLGTGTGAPPVALPANVTYWSIKSGSFINETANGWPNNYGIGLGLVDTLVNTYGYSAPITFVEYGVAGSSVSSWATGGTPTMNTAITAFAAAGVRPTVLCMFLGSVDADTGALRDAVAANISTLCARFRSVYGGSMGVVLGGLHTPDGGYSPSDEGVVDAALSAYALRHRRETCAYFSNQDMDQAGGFVQLGQSHLTGGLSGGSYTVGSRFAARVHAGGVLVAP